MQSVITDQLRACISEVDRNQTIWIAFSGGLDSTVLLHACNLLVKSTAHRLRAIHVNHQLHPDSSNWSQHCAQVCSKLEIPFEVIPVDAQAYMHLGLEAAAREARYSAFESRLSSTDVLFTAHHADDQLETVLLQLFRGAGAQGLSGCATQRALGAGLLMRPLLQVQRQDIAAYAKQAVLDWLEDPANDALQHDRNYLRHKLMPLLHARWQGLHATISRAALWQSENAELLNNLAEADLLASGFVADSTLSCESLVHLSDARLRNVLRWWIRQNGFQAPNAQVMQRIVADAVFGGDDREPCIVWQDCEIRKYRGKLYIQATMPSHDAQQKHEWDLNESLELPALQLTLTTTALNEFGLELNNINHLQVGFRVGGEVIRPRGRGCQKDLKTLFQEAGVLPWLRNRIPLLFKDGQLIFVWGYWISEGY